jgi:hypothetical protein
MSAEGLALPQKVPGGHTKYPFNVFYTVIAQLVEHKAFNLRVRGSNPRDGDLMFLIIKTI